MDDILSLFLEIFGGLEPQDLLTGPDPSLGTQVWVYDKDGNRVELTDPANQNQLGPLVGAGFSNPANKYSWSSAIYEDILYVGTFNAFFDYKGGIAAFIRISQQAKVGRGIGNLDDPSDLFDILTDNQYFPTVIESQGGEIWRYVSGIAGDPGAVGGTWEKVYDASEVPELGADVAGFRSMTTFDGKLLAASSSSLIFDLLSINQDQATTISVWDGTNWSVLTGGPFNNFNNSSIRTMKEVDGKLVIGVENAKEGAQIWLLDFDGNTPIWEQVASPAITYVSNSGIAPLDPVLVTASSSLYSSSSFAASTGDIVNLDVIFENNNTLTQFDNKFLIGTWQPYGLFMGDVANPTAPLIQIISPANFLAWGEGSFNDDSTPIGDGGVDNGVMRMEIYNGYLYVGSVNYTGGTSVLRIALSALNTRLGSEFPFDSGKATNGGWQILTTDGFRSLSSDLDPSPTNTINVVQLDSSGNEVANAVTDQVKGVDGDGISVYSWAMKVVNGKLYIGDFSGNAGTARLYEIEDLTTEVKIKIVEDTFGSEAYGLRTMQAYSPLLNGNSLVPTSPTNLIIGDADSFDSEIGLLNRFLDDPTRQVKIITNEGSGGDNDDVLFGAGPNVKILGLAGEDIIIGSNFADHLNGGDDQDLIIGNLGPDLIHGGGQSDLIWGDLPSFGANSLAEGFLLQLQALLLQAVSPTMLQEMLSSNPTAEGLISTLESLSVGNPEVGSVMAQLSQLNAAGIAWGEELLPSLLMLGNPNINLSSFNDTIYGDDGEDIVFGGLGDDKQYGGSENDILIGQQGKDSLWGNDGDDQLEGGRDADKYYGGQGHDIYDLRIQAIDSNGNMTMATDNAKDIIYYSMSDFEIWPVSETVFGFEQGLDKVDIAKKIKVSRNGNVATLTYRGKGALKGSTIELTNEDPAFLWVKSDFI